MRRLSPEFAPPYPIPLLEMGPALFEEGGEAFKVL
jgi:hypothetical protein